MPTEAPLVIFSLLQDPSRNQVVAGTRSMIYAPQGHQSRFKRHIYMYVFTSQDGSSLECTGRSIGIKDADSIAEKWQL